MTYSNISLKGRYRTLTAERYLSKPRHTAVIMLNGFIEGGYWYQLKEPGYHWAQFIESLGYDVHVLTIRPRDHKSTKSLPVDAELTDMLSELLPRYKSECLDTYDHLHMIGHSFGVPLILSFLMGLGPSSEPGRPFISRAELARVHQNRVRSVTSLAGMFHLHLDFLPRFEGPKRSSYSSKSSALSPFQRHLLMGLKKHSPYLPTGLARVLKHIPSSDQAVSLMGLLPPACVPFMHVKNTHKKALIEALAFGSDHESFGLIESILSIGPADLDEHRASRAFEHFRRFLRGFQLPIAFIQGEKELVTTPMQIKTHGHDQVGSKLKRMITLKNTGHQDILVPKNTAPLREALKEWLAFTSR